MAGSQAKPIKNSLQTCKRAGYKKYRCPKRALTSCSPKKQKMMFCISCFAPLLHPQFSFSGICWRICKLAVRDQFKSNADNDCPLYLINSIILELDICGLYIPYVLLLLDRLLRVTIQLAIFSSKILIKIQFNCLCLTYEFALVT